MRYNELGRTGLKVSEIGLGCEGFIGKDAAFTCDFFAYAIDNGVNLYDMYSPDPDMRDNVGKALRGRMDGFILQAQLCSVWKNGQYERTRDPELVRLSFEDLLRRVGADSVDIGMIHYVDSAAEWERIANGPVMEYALRLKRNGDIRHIGLSSHNPAAATAAAESGLADVIMFSVNPCYDLIPGTEDFDALWAPKNFERPLLNMDPEREAFYETCQRLGVGVTSMKTFGGGDLLHDYSPSGMALTPCQCIHYALTRPACVCVVSGARSKDELGECLAYESAGAEERDYAAALAAFPKMSWLGHCMYCGHCAPCPAGIDIASVTKFLNLVRAQGFIPETVREHYAALEHGAGECVSCGACEKRCPFSVPVRENMAVAKAAFGH